jgi:hypothetical protein
VLPDQSANQCVTFAQDCSTKLTTNPVNATLSSLQKIDENLWREALWVGSRIPSTPQRVNLNKKTLALTYDNEGRPMDVPPQRGFPQRRIDGQDWLNLRYLVVKVPYADASIRDEFEKPRIVQLRIPSMLGAPLTQMMEFFGKNQHSTLQATLARVRFDLVHIPKIGSGKGVEYTVRVTELSRVFPYAMHVWAEAAGPYENGVDMEVVRAFNISRRLVEGGRRMDLEESVASVAAQGGIEIREQWDPEVKRELRSAKRAFRAIRREHDCGYWNKQGNFVNGEKVALQCGGCYVRFVSKTQLQGQLDSWMVYDTRHEYLEHRRRASANRGALTLC